MNEVTFSNNMSILALKASQGDDLHIKPSKNKPGKFFFVCGSKTGYVSEKAVEALRSGKGAGALQYADVTLEDGSVIGTIMPQGGIADAFTL